MPSILIVDDEYTIRMMLSDFLENRYEVLCAENAEQALTLLSERGFDLVISDINMPGISGIELLRLIKKQYPGIKTALITAYNIDEYIKMIKHDGISNIIPKTVPFNFTELDSIIRGLISGAIFGLERYLLPAYTMLASEHITSSTEGREARERITRLFARKFGTAGDMKLVLDEIITNAIYHAPAMANGEKKYQTFNAITLQPDEYIELTCGYDNEKYGVSVVDRKGRLHKETVLLKMERQISGRGLLDDSGADRMIINIDPGKKTEVVVMNYFSPTFRGYKPLYINEL
jgi:CheY-like chemotaxis protein